MPPALDNLAALLHNAQVPTFGAAITYYSGGNSIELTAIRGKSQALSTTHGILGLEHSDGDFIVKAADLIIDDAIVEPKAGDRIVEERGELTLTYEVFPLSDEKCYRPCDAGGALLRIHTKLIKKSYAPPAV